MSQASIRGAIHVRRRPLKAAQRGEQRWDIFILQIGGVSKSMPTYWTEKGIAKLRRLLCIKR